MVIDLLGVLSLVAEAMTGSVEEEGLHPIEGVSH